METNSHQDLFMLYRVQNNIEHISLSGAKSFSLPRFPEKQTKTNIPLITTLKLLSPIYVNHHIVYYNLSAKKIYIILTIYKYQTK